MDEKEIISRCQDFLNRSSSRYSSERSRQNRSLEACSGKFWNKQLIKDWKREKKRNLDFNKFCTQIDSVSAPYTNSPYHTNIEEAGMDEFQKLVNAYESMLGVKLTYRNGFKRGASCGEGFIVHGIDDNDRPKVEFIANQSSVAFDPYVQTPSGEDADEGATINYITKAKAKRLYGIDEWKSGSSLDFADTMWCDLENQIQIVNYYCKDENGSVHLYKICADKVVKSVDMRISLIPIVRFAGFAAYDANQGVNYVGIVDKNFDLQLAENIAFSQLITRSNRVMKSRIAMSKEAMKGNAEEIAKCEKDESLVIPYNLAGGAPTILDEHFQTDDLTSVISTVRTLEQDVTGIALTGFAQNRTATENILQQVNEESNNDELYLNAESANRHSSKIILQILCGREVDFSLHNGPTVITTRMKDRQGISIVSAQLAAGQVIPAYYTAKSLGSQIGDKLAEAIKANNPGVKFMDEEIDDGDLVQQLEETKSIAQQAIDQANEIVKERDELKQQLNAMELQVMNTKEQQEINLQKMRADYELKVAELNAKYGIENNKNQIEAEKAVQKAENDAQKIELEKAKLVNEVVNG